MLVPWGLMYTNTFIAVFVYPRGVISASTEKYVVSSTLG
jgi:hypothetical protein